MRPGISATTIVLGIALVLAGCATGPPARHIPMQASDFEPDRSGLDVPSARKLPKLTDKSSLPDYLTYAALNNPGLEAVFYRWRAALERVPQVTALPDPMFTYRYYISEVETRVGAQRQSFAVAQKFPWFGKLALRGDVAAEAANVQRQRYETRKLKLFYDVKDAYYEYYYLSKSIRIVGENKQLLVQIERVLTTRFKAGAATHSSLIRAQVELGKLDDRLRSLRDLRGPIAARLNAALNRPMGAPLPWPAAVGDQKVTVTDEQLLTWLEESNPQLKALDFEIVRNRRRVDLAKKDYFPDATVGLTYIDTARAIGAMSPSDSGRDPVIAMVSVNLPIWWNKIAAGVREAQLAYIAAVGTRRQKANSLGASLKFAAYRFRDAARKIDLYRDTLLPKATESLGATQTSFGAGKASFTDLIDAQRIYLAFELQAERALANKAQRLAELEMLVGRPIPVVGNENAPADVLKSAGTKKR